MEIRGQRRTERPQGRDGTADRKGERSAARGTITQDDRWKPPRVALLSGSVLEIPVQNHIRARSVLFPRYETSERGGQDGSIFHRSHGHGLDLAILAGPSRTAVRAGAIEGGTAGGQTVGTAG